jgi:hypothetical protein
MTAAEKRLKVREDRKNGNTKKLTIGDVTSGVLNGIGAASDYVDKSVGIAGTPVNVYNSRIALKKLLLSAARQKDNKWADLGLEVLIPDSSDLLGGAGYVTRGADLLQALRIAKKTDPSTLKIGKAIVKDLKEATDDFIDGPPQTPAFAGLTFGQHFKNGGKKLVDNGTENGEKIANGSLNKMTAEEAATTWGKVTKAPLDELGITSAQKGADHGAMSRIVNYVESGRFNKLDHRNKKTIISSQIENSPIEYLVKYHGGDLLDAESHHILDIDFWGRALDIKNNKAVSTVLWKDGVHTGNAKKNIVWAWAARKGSMDHNTLHALYKNIPSRQYVENYMANGTWYTMKPDAQAKLLREVAYDQHRITNNFMNMKLNFILKEHPELSLLHPEHLKNKIVKNPRKYGEIKVIDPKNPEEVQQLLWTLKYSPHTGRVHPKVREVFGLETPKATAKEYSGSTAQTNFNLRLNHRLNKALKSQK